MVVLTLLEAAKSLPDSVITLDVPALARSASPTSFLPARIARSFLVSRRSEVNAVSVFRLFTCINMRCHGLTFRGGLCPTTNVTNLRISPRCSSRRERSWKSFNHRGIYREPTRYMPRFPMHIGSAIVFTTVPRPRPDKRPGPYAYIERLTRIRTDRAEPARTKKPCVP